MRDLRKELYLFYNKKSGTLVADNHIYFDWGIKFSFLLNK
jgi:hypothetical protein